jgi:hypothetical protein
MLKLKEIGRGPIQIERIALKAAFHSQGGQYK